ncbi:MAG: DUF3318 domain-containing protein [Cyanobacteria bacterium P01_A01_bin.135]
MTDTAPYQNPNKRPLPPPGDAELGRLAELLPASGRMWCRLVSAPKQKRAIAAGMPKPWNRSHTIGINLERWQQLPEGQRDLLLLRTVGWSTAVQWLKPNLSTALLSIGAVGTAVELFQSNAAGIILFSGLSVVAVRQIWRSQRSIDVEKMADVAGVRVAMRRGYTLPDAVRNLVAGIKALPELEGRAETVDELVRCQALKSMVQPDVSEA